MRAVLLILLVFWTCEKQANGAEPADRREQTSESPVVIALMHFSNSTEPLLPKSRMRQRALLVHREYWDNIALVSAAMFNVALGDEFDVPEDLRLQLERRTGAERTVPKTDVPPFCRLADLEKPFVQENVEEFAKNAKAMVCLWPTGLSADGNRALVVFRYGEAIIGRRAVYVLERRKMRWEILRYIFPSSD